MEYLKKYIEKWRKEKLKPCNEVEFIEGFIKMLNSDEYLLDCEFDGDGAYFGKQIIIAYCPHIRGDRDLSFEIAYSNDKISVYTANHNGFWQPEYLKLESGQARFNDVKEPLFKVLYRFFGLPNEA
jgi:hypothetical protein